MQQSEFSNSSFWTSENVKYPNMEIHRIYIMHVFGVTLRQIYDIGDMSSILGWPEYIISVTPEQIHVKRLYDLFKENSLTSNIGQILYLSLCFHLCKSDNVMCGVLPDLVVVS